MELPFESSLGIEANFRIMGETLQPDMISASLDLEPDYSHRRGDPLLGNQGRRYSDYSEGIWILKSSALTTAPIEAHIENLLTQLYSRKTVLHAIKSTGFRIDILIGVTNIDGNFAFSVSEELMGQAAELGLTLDFDFYTANRKD